MRKGEPGARVAPRAAGPTSASQAHRSAVLLRRNYDQPNLEAAKIIAANAERFGGDGAGLVEWSRAILVRLQPQRTMWGGA